MQLQLEVDEDYAKKFVDFIKTLSYIHIKEFDQNLQNENKDFLNFSGLWENREIDLSELREKAWKK